VTKTRRSMTKDQLLAEIAEQKAKRLGEGSNQPAPELTDRPKRRRLAPSEQRPRYADLVAGDIVLVGLPTEARTE
jgi:hypothetical protein